MSRLLKWRNQSDARVEGDLEWWADAPSNTYYRVVNRWQKHDDYKIYYAIYHALDVDNDVEVQVESPKAGIRWCEAHYVLCR